MLRLEPLLTAEITLGEPQDLGETPQGRRRIIPLRRAAPGIGRARNI
jgi:hypothetical protein